MQDLLFTLSDIYAAAKHQLGEVTGASEDLLHVHAGLAIFGVSAWLLRRRIRSAIPLALVVLFAAANEVVDVLAPAGTTAVESLADFANTVFWPAVLFLLARRAPTRTQDVPALMRDVPGASDLPPR